MIIDNNRKLLLKIFTLFSEHKTHTVIYNTENIKYFMIRMHLGHISIQTFTFCHTNFPSTQKIYSIMAISLLYKNGMFESIKKEVKEQPRARQIPQLNCTEMIHSFLNSPTSRKSEYNTKVQRQPY